MVSNHNFLNTSFVSPLFIISCRIFFQYNINVICPFSTLSFFLFSFFLSFFIFSFFIFFYFVMSYFVIDKIIAFELITNSENPRKFHFPSRLFGDHQGYLVNPPFASEKLGSSPARLHLSVDDVGFVHLQRIFHGD